MTMAVASASAHSSMPADEGRLVASSSRSLSRSASRASTSSFSSQASNAADGCGGDGSSRHGNLRYTIANPAAISAAGASQRQRKVLCTPTKKAKRIRFYRNGDRFFKGVVMPVTPERYRSFDSLLSDVTRTLKDHVTLPNGVRTLYTTDGDKVSSVDDLEDGKCYVCSGQGEPFKRIEYLNLSGRLSKPTANVLMSSGSTRSSRSPQTQQSVSSTSLSSSVRPRVVTLIRSGIKPRRVVRLLLNKRNAATLEHVMAAVTEAVKLDSGAARKVFSLKSGGLITRLEEFFNEGNDVFLVYGTERVAADDLLLDPEELKLIQAQKKSFPQGRRNDNIMTGVLPKMPKKKTGPVSNTTEPVVPSEIRARYKLGPKIGDGNFAVVRRCIDKNDGTEYAMKIIDKSKCLGREQMIANEVEILRKVRHPNIIRVLAECDTPTELYLVMELENADLFDAIAAVTSFSENEARLMLRHLASALAHLHSQQIVHRDVKPENLLVRLDENRKVRSLKLTDFGLAQVVVEPLTAVCGTPTYVAPEILLEQGYGLKVDVWAAGVILYILLCGFPPFVSTSDDPNAMQEELFDKILLGVFEFPSPYWDKISAGARDLISCMLQSDPNIRFSAEDVLDHPWLLVQYATEDLNSPIVSTHRSKIPLSLSKNLGFSG